MIRMHVYLQHLMMNRIVILVFQCMEMELIDIRLKSWKRQLTEGPVLLKMGLLRI